MPSPLCVSGTDAEKVLHLVAQVGQEDRRDPKALTCYGLSVGWTTEAPLTQEQAYPRFVDARPVGVITIWFLEWCCAQL